jgi:hypothetical protein
MVMGDCFTNSDQVLFPLSLNKIKEVKKKKRKWGKEKETGKERKTGGEKE